MSTPQDTHLRTYIVGPILFLRRHSLTEEYASLQCALHTHTYAYIRIHITCFRDIMYDALIGDRVELVFTLRINRGARCQVWMKKTPSGNVLRHYNVICCLSWINFAHFHVKIFWVGFMKAKCKSWRIRTRISRIKGPNSSGRDH